MAKHHPDLIMCRKQPGIAIGRLCEKCDGKCVICDSYVRPCTLVRVCDECNYGSFQGRCVICGGVGISDAYYCKECTQQEKDRDGCPKIVNLEVPKQIFSTNGKSMMQFSDQSICVGVTDGFTVAKRTLSLNLIGNS
ncbi:PHF5-like protein [Prunus dulcis]|uniref:PHF5-like protein n=1 Tax=Prunus dulcis TaxID=3755 RepID=A0A4Y1RQQ0_PRUDU|nr:PHF5-like protein [Prunus dulcis]